MNKEEYEALFGVFVALQGIMVPEFSRIAYHIVKNPDDSQQWFAEFINDRNENVLVTEFSFTKWVEFLSGNQPR